MSAPQRTAVAADIYKTDLERHLFAPGPRRKAQRARPNLDALGDWLRGRLALGLARWKAPAHST